MRKYVAVVVAATIVGIGTAAQAQSQSQAQPQAAAVNVAQANPVICEKEPELGSRLSSHKVCHTRSEWDQLRRDDRSVTERVQSQRSMDLNGH